MIQRAVRWWRLVEVVAAGDLESRVRARLRLFKDFVTVDIRVFCGFVDVAEDLEVVVDLKS